MLLLKSIKSRLRVKHISFWGDLCIQYLHILQKTNSCPWCGHMNIHREEEKSKQEDRVCWARRLFEENPIVEASVQEGGIGR